MIKIKKQDILNTFHLMHRLVKDIHHFSKMYLILRIIVIVLNASVPLVMVIFPRFIIDYVINGKYVNAVFVVLALFLFNMIYSTINQSLIFYFEVKDQLFIRQYEHKLMEKVMSIEYELVESASTHNMKEEAKRGAGNILQFINNVQNIITNIISLLFAAYLITYLNFWLVILIIVTVALNGYINYRKTQADIKMERDFAVLQRKWNYFNHICRDISNAKEIRLYHLSGWLSKKITHFVEDHEALIRSSYHNQSVSRRFAAFSEMIQEGVVYFYIGLQLWKGLITVGEFTQYIAAVNLVSSTIISITNNTLEIRKNRQFINNYYRFIDLNGLIPSYSKIEKTTPVDYNCSCIEIKDVWFRYHQKGEYVLKGISLTIHAGERLSLIGRNGCGKTTLIKLILRLYRPEKGQILLNGVDINEYDYEEYIRHFSVIFQDFKVFSFTIRDNILMSDMPLDSEKAELSIDIQTRMKKAIDKANLNEVITRFSNGILTYINKNYDVNGYEFSGGMQQSLSMCRAYYRDAGNIILDEPTAMLDPVGEYQLYKNFNKLIKDKTAIYISHRMASSRFCDKIAVLSEGVVKEYGTHDELIEEDGIYALLFNKQASCFKELEEIDS